MPLERLWAGWRTRYVAEIAGRAADCFLCALRELDEHNVISEETLVLERTSTTVTVLNLYPYGSGHVLVAPLRHEPEIDALSDEEANDLMAAMRRTTRAVKAAYQVEGLNIGFNIGRSGGAGVPSHLHGHVLPRWVGDTNFMTSIAETRVMPETLAVSWKKLHDHWPVA